MTISRALVCATALGALSVILAPVIGAQIAPAASGLVAGELLVQFRPGTPATSRQALRNRRRVRLLRRLGALEVERLRLDDGGDVRAAVTAIQSEPDVVAAQPNFVRERTAAGPPNDPYWLSDSLWGLQKTMSYAAWSNYTGGDGSVVVADIDSGVNYNHPDLAPNMWRNPGEVPGNAVDDDGNGYVDDVYGIDALNNDSDPMDDNGHGTHTAGTVGARGNNGIGVVGVSWNVKILACKFLNASGSGSDADAVECFNYIVGMKQRGVNVRVTTNSWGGARQGSPATVLRNAIDAAGNLGILNVVAAGNSGTNNDTTPIDPASFTSPSIVAVAASDTGDGRPGFSNYGTTSVDLAAPGVSIVSTYGNGYTSFSGTSMATPHVAGAAALLFMRNPGLSVAAAKAALLDGVDRVGGWSGLVASGGRLNVFESLQRVSGAQAPQVTVTAPANGATFNAPATVSLTATASDADGTVSSVAFYGDGALIATDTQSPYAATWSNVAAGTHSVTAVATDNTGATGTSASVSFTVTAGAPATTSPDGAEVPTVSQIVDSQGAVWTLGSSFAILRNGAPAAGGYGTKILWSGGVIYVFGTDGNWWKWVGSGWVNVGPARPGGSPSTPPSAGSPDGTAVPPASQIVDAQGATWTIGSGFAILRNGAPVSGYGSKILWSGGAIYVFGTDGKWWKWVGSGWIGVADPQGSQPAPPSSSPSPSGTVVPPASQIVDAQGGVWTIGSAFAILRNAAPAGGGYGTKILWSGGVIYVFGTDGSWWKWVGSGWVNVGTTQPS